MNEASELSKEDSDLIARYNIRSETRTVFFSEGYKYDNLKDAVRYAKLVLERKQTSVDH